MKLERTFSDHLGLYAALQKGASAVLHRLDSLGEPGLDDQDLGGQDLNFREDFDRGGSCMGFNFNLKAQIPATRPNSSRKAQISYLRP